MNTLPQEQQKQEAPPEHHTDEASCSGSLISTTDVCGVLFGRSIRAYYAILHLVKLSCENNTSDAQHVVVRIQFLESNAKTLRSWCRRLCKFGDLIIVRNGQWTSRGPGGEATEWKQDRYVVNISSVATGDVQVKELRFWNMMQCQAMQQKYLSGMVVSTTSTKRKESGASRAQDRVAKEAKTQDLSSRAFRHGGGLGKRKQGQFMASFLIYMAIQKLKAARDKPNDIRKESKGCDGFGLDRIPSWDPSVEKNDELQTEAIHMLNSGSGVVDAAGGSGHVSMALGMAGIKSTVVDPRESVGKLPKRDRKVWNKALKQTDTADYKNRAAVPYSTLRAWFGSIPDGVDTTFRQLDNTFVSYCGETSDSLIGRCSSIVALHPDEATDAVVDVAIQHGIPFAIVPCCVFGRLFPNRRKVDSDEPVSTYEDLLEYLVAKHPSIQAAKLPYEGANVVLWSIF